MLSKRPFRVTVILQPEFPMACLSAVIEPLRAANEIAGHRAFEWTLTTEGGRDVFASAGVRFSPSTAFRDEERSDLIMVLSPPSASFDRSSGSLEHIRRLMARGARVGAISGGVFVLARHGLLDPDYRASRHWCYQAAFDEMFPHLDASEELFVLDRGRCTASGAAGGVEMMHSLIREDSVPPNGVGAPTLGEVRA